uniref:Ribosomal protein S4 n=1 Tax=Cyanophora paradoxa TaxID=2762 RepID=E9P1C0_CYAPA|nr:ribosomal protein S4 [Cyanophora paradoxa]ADW79172.1 ribosomal protein S4 [Cyanophora paradoxa]
MQNYKIQKKFKRNNIWVNNSQFFKFKERLKWRLKKKKKLLHKSRNIWFNMKLYIKKIFKNFYPNLTEIQLKKYIGENIYQYLTKDKIKHSQNTQIIKIYHILESRLDTMLIRTNLVKTPKAARQLIMHKNVFVDNRLITNPGYLLSNGQIIHIKKINIVYLKIKINNKNNEFVYKKFKTILKKRILFKNYYKNFLLNTTIYNACLPSYLKYIVIQNKNYNYHTFLFNTPRLIEIPYPNKMWIHSICKRRTNRVKLYISRFKRQKFKKNKLYKLKIKKRKKIIIIGTRLNTIYSNIRLPKNLLKIKKNKKKKKVYNRKKKNKYNWNYYKKKYNKRKKQLNLIKKKKIKKKKYNKFIKFVKSFKLKRRKLTNIKLLLKKKLKINKIKKKKQKKTLLKKKKIIKNKKIRFKQKLKKKQRKEKIKIFSNNFFNILPWFYKRLKKSRLYMKK